jgi:hypothetical protein
MQIEQALVDMKIENPLKRELLKGSLSPSPSPATHGYQNFVGMLDQ